MFDAFTTFIRQTADTIHHAIDTHAGRIELRALAGIERILNARFNRMDTAMSDLNEKFAVTFLAFRDRAFKLETALDTARTTNASLSAQVGTLTAANVALQAAGTDADAAAAKAGMQDAIDAMMALTAEMDTHLSAPGDAASAPAPEMPAPAAQEPVQADEPDAAPVPAYDPVVPVTEPAPVPTEDSATFAPEPENAEDRAAVGSASTMVP